MPILPAARIGTTQAVPFREMIYPDCDTLLALEVKNIHDDVRAAIDQHDVASDQDMRASHRRRRQTALELLGTGHHFLAQAWRQGSTHSQLLFESGRQLIPFGQAGREVIVAIVVVIPTPHVVAVVVGVVVSIAIPIVVVAVVLSVSMPFCQSSGG
jgi:hypothetical protein